MFRSVALRVGAAPAGRGLDDGLEVPPARLEAEKGARAIGGRHQHGRIAGPPRSNFARDLASGHALDGGDHLAHGMAAARAEVEGLEGLARLQAECGDVGAPEVLHVHVVADAGPVRRRVVVTEDGETRRVAKRGVEMSISVVGFQVNDRVRRQLRCIARAGGGSYVDVDDADKLGGELSALLSRAFRSYDPTGTAVEGGEDAGRATPLGEGQYLVTIPAGAVRDSVVISAESDPALAVGVKFLPEGLQFEKPIELDLDYNHCNGLLSLLRLQPFRGAYVSDDGSILEYPASADDRAQRRVRVQIDHFSKYAVAY